MVYLAAFLVFSLAVFGMAVGVIFSGRKLSGSCGGLTPDGENLADCLCARKDNDICPSDEGNELVALSELGYPRRKDHSHHGHSHDASGGRHSGGSGDEVLSV